MKQWTLTWRHYFYFPTESCLCSIWDFHLMCFSCVSFFSLFSRDSRHNTDIDDKFFFQEAKEKKINGANYNLTRFSFSSSQRFFLLFFKCLWNAFFIFSFFFCFIVCRFFVKDRRNKKKLAEDIDDSSKLINGMTDSRFHLSFLTPLLPSMINLMKSFIRNQLKSDQNIWDGKFLSFGCLEPTIFPTQSLVDPSMNIFAPIWR